MFQPSTNMKCYPTPQSIGNLYVTRNSIDEKPPYQRESGVWSPQKKELFIDSLINNFDIPKIYFNDLVTGPHKKGLKKLAIIDGKQRITTIFDFLDSIFPLAKDFKASDDTEYDSLAPLKYFKTFSDTDKKRFENIQLSVITIMNATEDDIEELFFRLNNGEPLNAAEKRNNIPGEMNALVREVAENDFFKKRLKIKNNRYSHYEISAKLLLLELNQSKGGDLVSDLKKKFLDKMVEDHKKISKADKTGLLKRVTTNLSNLNKVFENEDDLLNKQAYPPLYYIFIKLVYSEYGHPQLHTIMRKFIEQFQIQRVLNFEKQEDDVDVALSEFSRLMQQGTNDLNSLKTRVSILRRFFLVEHPDVELLDTQRHFTDEERHVIYVLGGKLCAECQKEISLKEMEADHHRQWKFGGATTLKNGRCLCQECNLKLKENVK